MAKKPSEQSGISGNADTSAVERVAQFIAHMTAPIGIVIGILTAVIIAWVVAIWFLQDSLREDLPEQSDVLILDTSKREIPSRSFDDEEPFGESEDSFAEEARARREAFAKAEGFRITEDGRIIETDEDRRAREKERLKRRIRRFRWGSPAEERGRLWNVPQGESKQILETALLRVCMAEADGEPQDCVGIWQVLKNIRNRSCSRDFVRRITECEEDGGETMLSTIRRAQPHILAVPTYKLRNSRAGWIRNLETDCEMPDGWRQGENRWDARYGSKICPQTVELVRHLVKNELPPPRPGARLKWLPGRPITWGGRCETNRASCDDRIACARGLARIKNTGETQNAFWCRPGSPGCRQDAEPICVALGYGHLGEAKNKNNQGSQPTKTEEQQSAEEQVSEETKEGRDPLAVTESRDPADETSI